MKKPVSLIVMVFLIGVSLLHLLRLVFQVQVTVDGSEIPLWMSILGTIGPAVLAVLLRLEALKD
ncbi:MAG: hypothetical protein KKE17_06435 [Proteobacteria bacterium]|nr:hypothetical protein [Pseudomonadota bacterium]MBU1709625.1 hypothetical protein [Pseudomonadota bacterium]